MPPGSARLTRFHVERDILAKGLVGQRSINDTWYEMRLMWIFAAIHKADLLHEIFQPAEVIAGLVIVVGGRLSAVDQPDPRRMTRCLKMLRVLGVDLHDPIDVRHGDADLPSRHQDVVPAPEDREDFIVSEMLHDMTGIDLTRGIAREPLEIPDVVHDIDTERLHHIHIDIAGQSDIPASEVETIGPLEITW